eukprot:NODE_15764_length_1031_cov_12.043142.p2 GENE.NODE_15764_length_1031_cov_12.043142~~NODE_15764_length_1031_cov_12.043142.p2  ORF type:complete len:171 (+),score=15.62 NODE_15764_length_1031_cov_12.043142:115-627(+)
MEGGQKMHRHTMWGKMEKIADGSSSSNSKQRPLGRMVIPTGTDVLRSDSDRTSTSTATIANDRVSSSATAMISHEGAPCQFQTKVGVGAHCHEPRDTAQTGARMRRPRPNKTVRRRCKAVADAVASTGLTLCDGESAPNNPSVRTSYLTRLMKAQQKTSAGQHDEERPSS